MERRSAIQLYSSDASRATDPTLWSIRYRWTSRRCWSHVSRMLARSPVHFTARRPSDSKASTHHCIFSPHSGRKIIVDTYGGWGAHGGGAFSGKDFSKVDRSAAYTARWIAKSLVHAGLARRALVQLSYAIGVAEPLSIFVETYGTGKKGDAELVDIIRANWDLRPGVIGE